LAVFENAIARVSPFFGAHDFIVVLLALLTRRKLLQQIPRRIEYCFDLCCYFSNADAARQ